MRCFDRLDERIEYVGQFWAIEWTTALELEHTVALWSVAHLPPDQRRAYFGPENLRLRCVPCHKPKTKAEAAARAKGNRQAKMRLDVPVEKSKTPLRSRNAFPQKGQGRKMMSRPFPLRPNWK
jgi:hypothetical protein